MLSPQILDTVSTILQEIASGSQQATAEVQKQVIQLLIDCLNAPMEAGDSRYHIEAVEYLQELLVDGVWGFTKNPARFFATWKAYKFETLQHSTTPVSYTIESIYEFPLFAEFDCVSANYNLIRPWNSVEEFIAAQKIIRILIDNAMGFGHQAANRILIDILNHYYKYGNTIEFIYPFEAQGKIKLLFGLAENEALGNSSYFHKELNVKLITTESFYAHHENYPAVTLSLTAGIDPHNPEEYNYFYPLGKPINNLPTFAEFLKSELYVKISPYYAFDTTISLTGNNRTIFLPGSRNDYIKAPKSWSLSKVQKYLVSDSAGQVLAKKVPVLANLITAIKNRSINFSAAYGVSLLVPENIISLLCAFRNAQIRAYSDKAMVVGLFYVLNSPSQFMEMLQKIKYPSYLTNIQLVLPHKNNNISTLHANHTYLFMLNEYLPQKVFNALFAYEAENILPPILEGLGTYANILNRNKGHIYCGQEGINSAILWPVLQAPITTPTQKTALTELAQAFCGKNRDFLKTANYILDVRDETSWVAKFFRDLNSNTNNPHFDRIRNALTTSMKIAALPSNEIRQQALGEFLKNGYFFKKARRQIKNWTIAVPTLKMFLMSEATKFSPLKSYICLSQEEPCAIQIFQANAVKSLKPPVFIELTAPDTQYDLLQTSTATHHSLFLAQKEMLTAIAPLTKNFGLAFLLTLCEKQLDIYTNQYGYKKYAIDLLKLITEVFIYCVSGMPLNAALFVPALADILLLSGCSNAQAKTLSKMLAISIGQYFSPANLTTDTSIQWLAANMLSSLLGSQCATAINNRTNPLDSTNKEKTIQIEADINSAEHEEYNDNDEISRASACDKVTNATKYLYRQVTGVGIFFFAPFKKLTTVFNIPTADPSPQQQIPNKITF